MKWKHLLTSMVCLRGFGSLGHTVSVCYMNVPHGKSDDARWHLAPGAQREAPSQLWLRWEVLMWRVRSVLSPLTGCRPRFKAFINDTRCLCEARPSSHCQSATKCSHQFHHLSYSGSLDSKVRFSVFLFDSHLLACCISRVSLVVKNLNIHKLVWLSHDDSCCATLPY